jgi:hypothetical protein
MGGMIPLADVIELQKAFRANPRDIGVGLYNPTTGDIRLGSFDLVTGGQGHQGLADRLGITDNGEWRGFLVSSNGKFIPTSHFNLVDGRLMMRYDHAGFVEQELRQVGLLS